MSNLVMGQSEVVDYTKSLLMQYPANISNRLNVLLLDIFFIVKWNAVRGLLLESGYRKQTIFCYFYCKGTLCVHRSPGAAIVIPALAHVLHIYCLFAFYSIYQLMVVYIQSGLSFIRFVGHLFVTSIHPKNMLILTPLMRFVFLHLTHLGFR